MTKMPKHILLILFPICLTMTNASASVVNAVSSNLNPIAQIWLDNGNVRSISNYKSQTTTINPLSSSVDAIITKGTNSIESKAVVTANWSSPDSGVITLNKLWVTKNNNIQAIQLEEFDGLGDLFNYTFKPFSDGKISIDYSIEINYDPKHSDTGHVIGGGIGMLGQGISVPGTETPYIKLTGTISDNFVAGVDYTFTIHDGSGIGGGFLSNNESLKATFNFNITSPTVSSPVPLPSAIWIFLSGLISILGIKRRKL